MRILIVEDEHKIAAALKKGLEQDAYAVDVCYTGQEGYDLTTTETYELIILDRMLPEIDGLVLCQKIRNNKNNTPILMLTAKGQIHDRVEGLNAGADDYLVKPFAFEELLARIKALTRRPTTLVGKKLQIADLELDTITYTITRGGHIIQLSAKEFALLEYMLRHQGQILSKNQIIQHVWNYDANILPNTVEVFVGYLRQKIDKPFKTKLIHTIRGFGYKIGENNSALV